MSYTIRPISDRSAFTGEHEYSRFDSPWSATERLLLFEVEKLDGDNLVLELDVTERDIRLDGQLRANAQLASPAVRVAFDSKHGPLTYATDKFYGWKNNIRAIALGLESLRRVDRYGITKRGEQYTGWKALEATPTGMGHEAALQVIATYDTGAWTEDTARRYRRARASAHPDRNRGDRTAWDLVEQAGKVLGFV